MPIFQVGRDYETSQRAGAGGMFQIDTLVDENENEVTDRIDVGIHFSDDDQLKEYLAEIFDIPVDEIEIDEL